MRFERPVKDGGYAWWYVDAVSDDGTQALTLIAFIGSVFSPYYSWAKNKTPENFCAINLALYRPRGSRWAMTERSSKSVRRSAHELQIGPSALHWHGNGLTAEIDEICAPVPQRLRGQITLKAEILQPAVFCLDAGQRHRWQPIAPKARIEVKFDNPKLRWQGNGYFDSNDGDAPLQDDFKAWHWSRAQTPHNTKILYDVTRQDGSQHLLALDVDATGTARHFNPPPPQKLPRTAWGIEQLTRADDGAKIQQLRHYESTPFYARSLLETQINGETLTCLHESLDLRRFQTPWVRLLLPFRMPRYG